VSAIHHVATATTELTQISLCEAISECECEFALAQSALTNEGPGRINRTTLLSAKKLTPGYLLFSRINYLHIKLTKLTLFVCCLVTRN
jgi:hypothetical protein